MLKPELEQIEGFIDNIRYKSLTRDGWILSLSGWRDEKSLVRWRTKVRHHEAQQSGRDEILMNYHLRIGQITQDTHVPAGQALQEQRLDQTEVGAGTAVTLVTAKHPAEWQDTSNVVDCARFLGLDPHANGLLEWDVYDAVLSPGDLILMITWKDQKSARAFENELTVAVAESSRFRRVRIIRDYGMFDRREAPQYYPDAKGAKTVNA